MDFAEEMKLRNKLIETELDNILREKQPPLIYEAMRYSTMSGGKRIRPQMLLASCESCGGTIKSALPFACALEMIHTYSMIHDDLPCMDNDDFRRGKPSLHKAFPEAIAVLAGDGLLNLSYEVMTEACLVNGENHGLEAMKVIATAAGVEGMIGGQCVDIINENVRADEATIVYIHEHKTGKLIKAALEAGAVIAGASKSRRRNMAKLGERLGLAFQIKDDILDLTASAEALGRPTGSDEKNKKNTWVSLHGLEKAQQYYGQICDEIREMLNDLRGETEYFDELCVYMLERNK